MALIDLDHRQVDATPAAAAPTPVPFHVWLRAWAPQRPAAAAAVGTCIVSVIAALVVSTSFAVRHAPTPPPSPLLRIHAFAIATDGADEVATTVVRRDAVGLSVSRGEVLGSEPMSLTDIAAISVTVTGVDASCSITVDGQVADQAGTSDVGGPVTCLWIAG